MAELVSTHDDGAVRVITMQRPEALNAFNAALYRSVADALDAARADDGVSIAVLTGTGRAFSAGQDLKEMARLAAGEEAEVGFPALIDALVAFDKPLIAAVNGLAIGIGFTLLPHCDLVLVAESARFRTPFAQLGVAPEAASSFLFPQRMGLQRAAYVLMTGAWLESADAVEYGFAFARYPDGDLLAKANELAQMIALAPLGSLRAIKQTMVAPRMADVAAAREREDAAFGELLSSAATVGALDAFGS
jgi:enoyl-CoA hydratase/carnithine racemase